jgi:hypothetical protein
MTDPPGARHDYLHNMDKTVLGILRADDAVLELIKDGPGHPGRPSVHNVSHSRTRSYGAFCMGAQGA